MDNGKPKRDIQEIADRIASWSLMIIFVISLIVFLSVLVEGYLCVVGGLLMARTSPTPKRFMAGLKHLRKTDYNKPYIVQHTIQHLYLLALPNRKYWLEIFTKKGGAIKKKCATTITEADARKLLDFYEHPKLIPRFTILTNVSRDTWLINRR